MADAGPASRHLHDALDDGQYAHGIRRAAPEVEGLARARGHAAARGQECFDEVPDVQEVTHLMPVAVDGDRLVPQGTQNQVGHPPLVFGTELPGAIDARHAEHDRRQPVAACVVEYVLVGATLAAAVRTMEVERRALRYAVLSILLDAGRIALRSFVQPEP